MDHTYRHLTDSEIATLRELGNSASDWSRVMVSGPFCPAALRGNRFEGTVRLGAVDEPAVGMPLGEGIAGSTLADCTVGDHPAIHQVRLLCGYAVGNHVALFNIGEMSSAAGAEAWLEPMNENGGRRLMPCAGMTVGDAYLWARYRGRKALMQRLEGFSRAARAVGSQRTVGDWAVVKNTQTIRGVDILSTEADRTVVDGSIALVDGVVGTGCTIGHGVIAERFLLGEHVHLEFGLRLNDTVVGDNTTLARGEVGNSVIFPAHEQHHNNSFLIAALVMGQSNVAAGATIGSNHNSRTADGELSAGRGFWPGLCCSFKHSSRFASYCLLAKGDYPAEMDIPLPFALVNNNVGKDRLEVMPAYWWMYNMYAIDRCQRKFAARDKRVTKAQHIEFSPLAPDTAEEIVQAMDLLLKWIAASKDGVVYAEGMEKSKRPTVVLKAAEGLKAYEDMLVHYAMTTLRTAYGDSLPPALPDADREWVNLGGQLITKNDMEQLIADIENSIIGSWDAMHTRLDDLWQQYPATRAAHAYGTLCRLAGTGSIDETLWQHCLTRHEQIKQYVADQIVASRHKDDTNPFRHATYWDDAEMDAVLER